MPIRAFLIILAASLCGAAAINYTYDSAGRLIKADYGNGSVIAYAYDKAGNLLSRTIQSVSSGGPQITAVATASGGPAIAQNTWITINGNNLVPASTPAAGVIWSNAPEFASGMLPTTLSGVSVTVHGKPAYVYFYCSAATSSVCKTDQINVLTPLDSYTGPAPVVVTSGTVASPPFNATMNAVAPTFLLFTAQGYIAATHANNSLLGPTTLYPGSTTPAKPGETITAYTVGFGLPNGTLTPGSSTQQGSLPTLPVCQIGGNSAALTFAGLISPGLYQLNIVVPAQATSGDNPISCTYSGASTASGALITVMQ